MKNDRAPLARTGRQELLDFFLPRRRLSFEVAAFSALLALTACGASQPSSLELNQQLMKTETSPIPGAQAKLLTATSGTSGKGSGAGFCVTDAGYCPLASTVEPGRNCLCEAGSLAYGGKTGAAPKTYKAPFFNPPS